MEKFLKILCSFSLLLAVFGCGGDGGDDPGNTAPVASAGPDQQVATGSLVTLDGSGSSDAEGDLLSYRWLLVSRPGGSSASLSAEAEIRPVFTADVEGTYEFLLTVNDGELDSAADSVTVTAATANSAPVANAGADREVMTGALVTLDGSASSDADDDPLSYRWSLIGRPEGSAAALSSTTVAGPTFTPDLPGDYVLQLIVNDGTANSAADTVTLTAAAPPLLLAGRWTPPEPLQGSVGLYNHWARGAVNGSGASVVSWGQQTSSSFWANATLASLFDPATPGWGEATTLIAGAADPFWNSVSAVGIDEAGRAMVSRVVKPAVGEDQLRVYRFDPAAGVWDGGTILTPAAEGSLSCEGLNPRGHSLVLNGAGDAVVAWTHECVSSYGWYTNIYARLYDPATGVWSGGGRLDIGSGYYSSAHLAALAMGTSGQAAVAWTHDPPAWSGAPAEGLYAQVYNAGSGEWTWANLATVAAGSGSIGEVVLAVDPAGNVVAVWRHGSHLFWSRYDGTARSWSAPLQLDGSGDPFDSSTASQPAITCDDGGNFLVTWIREDGSSGRSIVSRRYDPATAAWGAPATLPLLSSYALGNLKVGADAQGNAVAIFMASQHIYSSRFQAATGSWATSEMVDDAEAMIDLNDVDLAVSPSGEALVTWIQDTDGPGPLFPQVLASRLERRVNE